MADIANLKVGNSVYSIKDSTARTTASNADTKADQAINDSAVAQADANLALYDSEYDIHHCNRTFS